MENDSFVLSEVVIYKGEKDAHAPGRGVLLPARMKQEIYLFLYSWRMSI